MRLVGAIIGVGLMAAPVLADAVDERAARKMLFSDRGHAVQVADGLSETDAATVRAIIPLMAEQLRQPVRYYAAIAWSPENGLVHDSLQGAMNHHTPGAAARAAVAACNAQLATGTGCEVAAWVVPKRYKRHELSLSVSATAAFNGTYRKTDGPKVFAISPALGSWSIATGEAAALADCAAQSGAADCEVVIRD